MRQNQDGYIVSFSRLLAAPSPLRDAAHAVERQAITSNSTCPYAASSVFNCFGGRCCGFPCATCTVSFSVRSTR
eukprot:1974950-Amphidinium_carterae.1